MKRKADTVLAIIMGIIGLGFIITGIAITWHYIGALSMLRDSFWIMVHEGHTGMALLVTLIELVGAVFCGISKVYFGLK
jgi:hypothetical protein